MKKFNNNTEYCNYCGNLTESYTGCDHRVCKSCETPSSYSENNECYLCYCLKEKSNTSNIRVQTPPPSFFPSDFFSASNILPGGHFDCREEEEHVTSPTVLSNEIMIFDEIDDELIRTYTYEDERRELQEVEGEEEKTPPFPEDDEDPISPVPSHVIFTPPRIRIKEFVNPREYIKINVKRQKHTVSIPIKKTKTSYFFVTSKVHRFGQQYKTYYCVHPCCSVKILCETKTSQFFAYFDQRHTCDGPLPNNFRRWPRPGEHEDDDDLLHLFSSPIRGRRRRRRRNEMKKNEIFIPSTYQRTEEDVTDPYRDPQYHIKRPKEFGYRFSNQKYIRMKCIKISQYEGKMCFLMNSIRHSDFNIPSNSVLFVCSTMTPEGEKREEGFVENLIRRDNPLVRRSRETGNYQCLVYFHFKITDFKKIGFLSARVDVVVEGAKLICKIWDCFEVVKSNEGNIKDPSNFFGY